MADVAVLILYNDKGEVYLQHRTAYKERWANHWGTFGGGIDEGETPEEALRRELREELGYEVSNPVKLFEQVLAKDTKHVYAELYAGQELCPDPNECQDARWVRAGDLDTLELIPHDKEALLQALKELTF